MTNKLYSPDLGSNNSRKHMRTAILLFAAAAAALLAGCENENLNTQLSMATSEADKHTGVILYSGYSFQLVRVKIDGVDYIANTKGGLVREH